MRILFVAMGDSVHTARWVSQLQNQKWDIHLFPTHEYSNFHPDLRDITVHSLLRRRAVVPNPDVRQTGLPWPFRRGARVASQLERLIPQWAGGPARLARLIGKLRPDIVHTLEMQSAGYMAVESRRILEKSGAKFPPWIYSSWGSDIYYYSQQPEHVARVRSVLRSCDYYISDCQRDVKLARDFGFQGEILGVFPVAGGYDISRMLTFRQSGSVSDRKTIALKGYQGILGGRAIEALRAIELCTSELRGYEIIIYSPSPETVAMAGQMSKRTGIPVRLLTQSPHDDILRIMGGARIAISVGIRDGVPNAMLEAMVMGAFPIQSDTGDDGMDYTWEKRMSCAA